ncbi:MAG: SurA N-terminal domain-containing protein [Candidatus Binatia bacterium]
MLDFLRKRRRSWVIVFFVGVISFVFALYFGTGSFVGRPTIETVAKVNGEPISSRELEAQYRRVVETYRNLFKGTMTQEAIESLNLRSGLLDELIQRRLLLQEARRLGLEATDEEIADRITRNPAFQTNGRFNKGLYLRILRSRRLTPGQFEKEQKEELTIQKLYHIIQDSVYVTEAEVRDRYRLERERINLHFIRLPAKDFMQQVKVTGEEIRDYYEQNKEALREPTRVQVEYVAYPFTHFSSRVQVRQEEIEDFYNVYRDSRFHQPKAVRLRHILFRVPSGVDFEQQREKARLKAKEVLRQAREGKDFAQLAKEHSDDPSGARGGDAGFFTQEQLLPALQKVAFALKEGEIGNVVESSLGFHILKVEEIRAEKTKSLKEAEEEIIRAIKQERGRDEAVRAAEMDREKVLEGVTLSLIAKERQLSLQASPFFTRNEVLPEIGPVEEFYRTAFALTPKQVSPVVDGPKASYLIKLKERKESRIPPLSQIRSDLEKKLKGKKAMELATEKGISLLGQLKEKKDMEQLAGEHGLRLEETGWFARGEPKIPKIGILQEIQPGGIPVSPQQPIPEQIYTQKDAVYLFAFKESRGADMESFEKEKGKLQETALSEKRRRALQRFVESLKVRARIEVQSEALAVS